MKASCRFVQRIRAVFNPVLGVVQQLTKGHRDRVPRDADVVVGAPELPRPSPGLVEHPPVQLHRKVDSENVPAATEDPPLSFDDVRLFPGIEFAPREEVGDEALCLVWIERRRAIFLRHYPTATLATPATVALRDLPPAAPPPRFRHPEPRGPLCVQHVEASYELSYGPV